MSIDLLSGPIPGPTPGQYGHFNHFSEYFWGEKNLGFHVLYHNMKHGQISVKDLHDFIRESASAEEMYAKQMTKLAKQAASCNALGTFSPLMDVLRVMTEKLSSCHTDILLKLHDIMKELTKYLEEQKSKHKHTKDQFSGTAEALHNIQLATASVLKSKEKYNQLCVEEERLKKTANIPQRDIEKAGTKSKKAAEDYKNQVAKYASIREDFEQKMLESTKEFQKIENTHLGCMKAFLDTYVLSFENANVLINQVHQEFRRQLNENTVDRLIKHYSEQKGTGTERPTVITFEEFNSSVIYENTESMMQNHTGPTESAPPAPVPTKAKKETTGGLFGIRRRKPKARNDTSTNSSSSKDSKDAESMESPGKELDFRIDDEGYTIRPETPDRSDKNSFNFSSGSDSDSDSDDVSVKKIQIRIKPKEATDSGGSDLETLNAITKNLTLGSPSPMMGSKKFLPPDSKTKLKSSPSNQSTSSDKMSNEELLRLYGIGAENTSSTVQAKAKRDQSAVSSSDGDVKDLFAKPNSAKRPKENGTSIKKGPAPPLPTAIPQSSSAKSLDDILTLSEINSSDIDPDIPPPRPPKPAGTLLPPQPALSSSRPNDLGVTNTAKPASREGTPAHSAPLASSESWSSLSSAGGTGTPTQTPVENFAANFASVSRGPSPLTLSYNDPIPIAVAFSETVNAYFKEADMSKSLTKITGEVQISFPAGITRAFTSNPNPSVLSFRIQCPGQNSIVNMSHDRNLLQKDSSVADSSAYAFSFDMPSLVAHVKKMAEKDPSSPHYNIHIISYLVASSYQTMPLQVTSFWKCEPTSTDIKIDYKYNSTCTSAVLQSLNVIVPIQGAVTDIQSVPQSTWNSAQNRLCWQVKGHIASESDSSSLQSKLTMTSGPSKPSALAVQFLSEGSTMSGADFKLVGAGYRISLIKKRFITGKYLSESC